MVLDIALLNTQQYKVRIEGKVGQSSERSSALPYTSVLQLLKREPSGRPRLRSPTLLINVQGNRWNESISVETRWKNRIIALATYEQGCISNQAYLTRIFFFYQIRSSVGHRIQKLTKRSQRLPKDYLFNSYNTEL